MSDQAYPKSERKSGSLVRAVLLLLPLIVLGGVIILFLTTGGGLTLKSPVPVESLVVERTILRPGEIELQIRNASPQELTLAQAVVNSAVWPFTASPGATIPRLGKATVHFNYPWVEGEAYAISVFSSNAIAFNTDIPVALPTPVATTRTFWSFTLIGLYVGIIPVYLGIFWFPALRQMGRRWMTFLLAITAGLLIFLGLDTVVEAIEKAAQLATPLQGFGLAGIGAVATFFLLDAIGKRQNAVGKSATSQRLAVSFMIAAGIGLHNLGEGLAIGAAYNVGEIALGSFLVVGFILQNITEGLGIIAPILRDHPGWKQLALLGLIGGMPAVLGAWVGGFAPSPNLAVLFLAIGTGAIFEVVYEIFKLIQKDTARESMPLTVFSGVVTGMLVMWVTGLMIK